MTLKPEMCEQDYCTYCVKEQIEGSALQSELSVGHTHNSYLFSKLCSNMERYRSENGFLQCET